MPEHLLTMEVEACFSDHTMRPHLGDPGGEHCRLSIIVPGSDGAQGAHKPANCLLRLCGLLCAPDSCFQLYGVFCCYWEVSW